MAKKMCKCAICGKEFDRNAIQAVKHGARRYSHATCEPDNTDFVPLGDAVDPDLEELKAYITNIYKDKANWKLINTQIKNLKAKNYTYSGMLKALKYWYEIKHNLVEKSNGGIGILEYTYEPAKQYYYAIWLAQQQTQDKKINFVTKEYTIPNKTSRGLRSKLITMEDWIEDTDITEYIEEVENEE